MSQHHFARLSPKRVHRGLWVTAAAFAVSAALAGCFGTDNGGNGDENEPPVITAHPVNDTAAAGATASFSVTATDALDYQWIRGETDTLAGQTMATLELTDVTEEMDGTTYKVVVSNTHGSVTSNSATLAVTLTPPVITAHPVNDTATAGDTASFSVTATGALDYQWIRGEADTLAGETMATLELTDVPVELDGTTYKVVVSNTHGSVTSNSATLTVALTPPSILTQPADTLIAAGDTVMLAVEAEGGNLSYQWSKDGDTLTGATSATLAIEDVSYDQYGRYTVSVTNDSGGSVVSDTAVVLVNGPDAARAVLIEYGGNGLDGNAAVFQNCTGCHYPGGVGHAGIAPPLANSDHILNNRERTIEVLLRGGFADSAFIANGVPYAEGGGGGMPSFSYFSDFQIASVLSYIRGALNDSLVTSCEPYDPNDPDTYDENGFAFCTKVPRDSADIAADSVAVWEVTAVRDSLTEEGILN